MEERKQLIIKFPVSVHRELKLLSADVGASMNYLTVEAVKNYLKMKENEKNERTN